MFADINHVKARVDDVSSLKLRSEQFCTVGEMDTVRMELNALATRTELEIDRFKTEMQKTVPTDIIYRRVEENSRAVENRLNIKFSSRQDALERHIEGLEAVLTSHQKTLKNTALASGTILNQTSGLRIANASSPRATQPLLLEVNATHGSNMPEGLCCDVTDLTNRITALENSLTQIHQHSNLNPQTSNIYYPASPSNKGVGSSSTIATTSVLVDRLAGLETSNLQLQQAQTSNSVIISERINTVETKIANLNRLLGESEMNKSQESKDIATRVVDTALKNLGHEVDGALNTMDLKVQRLGTVIGDMDHRLTSNMKRIGHEMEESIRKTQSELDDLRRQKSDVEHKVQDQIRATELRLQQSLADEAQLLVLQAEKRLNIHQEESIIQHTHSALRNVTMQSNNNIPFTSGISGQTSSTGMLLNSAARNLMQTNASIQNNQSTLDLTPTNNLNISSPNDNHLNADIGVIKSMLLDLKQENSQIKDTLRKQSQEESSALTGPASNFHHAARIPTPPVPSRPLSPSPFFMPSPAVKNYISTPYARSPTNIGEQVARLRTYGSPAPSPPLIAGADQQASTEWMISDLRRRINKAVRGSSIVSETFSLFDIPGFRLDFFPLGTTHSPPDTCAIGLIPPTVETLRKSGIAHIPRFEYTIGLGNFSRGPVDSIDLPEGVSFDICDVETLQRNVRDGDSLSAWISANRL